MDCLPRCDIPLPEIGAARVSTTFNACAQPAELSIRVIHEVRSVSTFLAGDQSVDSRKIGTEHWPLKLNVQFYEHSPDEYYAKACILTERTGQITCFMNSTYSKEALLDECDSTRLGMTSSFPMLLLSGLLIVLFLAIGVGIVFLVHHVFAHVFRAVRSNRKFHKKSQCAALLPAIQTQKFGIEEDRLTVIEEEREESSRISPSPSSTETSDGRAFSFISNETTRTSPPQMVQTMATANFSTMRTFQPAPQAV
ncbi:unnamed protein product [Cylicocyclus nassatus]|uniref:Uncharacterized protein n=1 Tax=Cylicocyclus nassatus TaxID=53992 RepID=A0AA36DTG8_CYLNA|nr:unnamed protein product [Cylicocyclus nassatus]